MQIPNWNLLIVNYNGFKLARFYDKNVKIILKYEIRRYISSKIIKNGNRIKIKKIRKFVLKRFLSDYGSNLILDSFSDLINEKKLKLE